MLAENLLRRVTTFLFSEEGMVWGRQNTLISGGNETSLVLTFSLVSLPRRPPDTSLVTEKWSRYQQKGLFPYNEGSFHQMRHLSQGSFSRLSPWSRYQKESRTLVSFSRSGLVTTTN